MTKKEFIKKAYAQIVKTGIIYVDWSMLGIRIIPGHNRNGFQLEINTKSDVKQVGAIREYQGEYDTLSQAQSGAMNFICTNSKMYLNCN